MPPVETQTQAMETPRYINDPMGLTGNGVPTPKQSNNIRDIQITQLDHGYVVVIGCQRFAIENSSTLIAKLSEYILNPAATEQKWNEGKLF